MAAKTPAGLDARGRHLWASLLAQDASLTDESNPNRETALTACRVADRLEELEQRAMVTDVIYEGRGGPVTHPVHIECRQVAALLPRLLAALRLPDEATGKRPQRRQVRGVQQPTAVSAKDRLKAV